MMDNNWFGKTIYKTNWIKKSKNKKPKQNAASEKKPPARKRISVQTPFSQSSLKLQRKILRRKITRFFCSTSFSGVPKPSLQFDLNS